MQQATEIRTLLVLHTSIDIAEANIYLVILSATNCDTLSATKVSRYIIWFRRTSLRVLKVHIYALWKSFSSNASINFSWKFGEIETISAVFNSINNARYAKLLKIKLKIEKWLNMSLIMWKALSIPPCVQPSASNSKCH